MNLFIRDVVTPAPWAESNFVSRPRRQNGTANARHEGHLPRLSGIVTAFSDESKFFAGSFPRASHKLTLPLSLSLCQRQFLPSLFRPTVKEAKSSLIATARSFAVVYRESQAANDFLSPGEICLETLFIRSKRSLRLFPRLPRRPSSNE